jgi:hypothetical protein
MISLIEKKFITSDVCEDITELLTFLESKGVLPPAYEKLVEAKGMVGPSPEMKLFYKIPCNEWEPEND